MTADPRGVLRGYCTICTCYAYSPPPDEIKCQCGHAPGKHSNDGPASAAGAPSNSSPDDSFTVSPHRRRSSPPLRPPPFSSSPQFPTSSPVPPRPREAPRPKPRRGRGPGRGRGRQQANSLHIPIARKQPSTATPFMHFAPAPTPRCRFRNCREETHFDPNTGESSPYCMDHQDAELSMPNQFSSSMFLTDGYGGGPMLQPQRVIGDFTNAWPQAVQDTLFQPSRLPMAAPHTHSNPFVPYFHPSPSTPHFQTPGPPAALLHPPQFLPQASMPTQVSTGPTAGQYATQPLPEAPTFTPVQAPTSSSPQISTQLQCKYKGCNKKRYQEGDRMHDFCGRTHAEKFQIESQGGVAASGDMKCKTPGCPMSRHKQENGAGYYDYCSLSCRDGRGIRMNQAAAGQPCSYPGCNSPKYVDPVSTRVHDFCSRLHANQAQVQNMTPVACKITTEQPGSPAFTQVQAHFTRTWVKGTCPNVSFVFSITNDGLQRRWLQYQQKLLVKTVEPYYHGTKLVCDIANQGTICTNQECGVCGISKTGLDLRCIRKNINFQRFGHGFYLAPNSSKCHDYTQTQGSNFRVILQCDILPGNKHNLTQGDQKLKGPPPGCHSVYGKVGRDLNYEEIVVYNADCVMPRYIILYQKDGVHKIAK